MLLRLVVFASQCALGVSSSPVPEPVPAVPVAWNTGERARAAAQPGATGASPLPPAVVYGEAGLVHGEEMAGEELAGAAMYAALATAVALALLGCLCLLRGRGGRRGVDGRRLMRGDCQGRMQRVNSADSLEAAANFELDPALEVSIVPPACSAPVPPPDRAAAARRASHWGAPTGHFWDWREATHAARRLAEKNDAAIKRSARRARERLCGSALMGGGLELTPLPVRSATWQGA